MTSKSYFAIAGFFIALYVVASLGVAAGLPDWVHQVCTIVFALAVYLGLKEQKKEKAEK